MQCPSCQHENPAAANFCLHCGSKLAKVCPQCQQVLPPEARFCFACGTPLTRQSPVSSSRFQVSSSQPPVTYTPKHLAERILAEQAAMEARGVTDGERKTITALFADMAGSTALIRDLDPEDARRLGRLWQRQGKQHAARNTLSDIYGWFTEGFDTKDLQEAKALLDSLESSV